MASCACPAPIYYSDRCHQSYIPYDEVLGLRDEISPGLLPLVCLAGTLLPFADATQDVLQRFSGVRVSASTVLRRTQAEGERLRAQLKEGRMVEPTQPERKWTVPRKEGQPAACVFYMSAAAKCGTASGRNPTALPPDATQVKDSHSRFFLGRSNPSLALRAGRLVAQDERKSSCRNHRSICAATP